MLNGVVSAIFNGLFFKIFESGQLFQSDFFKLIVLFILKKIHLDYGFASSKN